MRDRGRSLHSALPCRAELRCCTAAVLEEGRQAAVLVAVIERVVAEHTTEPWRKSAPQLPPCTHPPVGHPGQRIQGRRHKRRRAR